MNLKWIAIAALLAAGCAHQRAMKDLSDCKALTAGDRLACSECTAKNIADGWLGIFEYRPDAPGDATSRCVRVK